MKAVKTVAIVINTSWNIYNFRVGLLKALQSEGYRIVTIAPEDSFTHKLVESGFEYHPVKMNNKGTNPLEDLRLTADLYRLFKKIGPDILLFYTIKPNIYGTIAAALAGIPVINNISGLGTVFLDDSLSSRIARILYRFALRHSQKVFFQNGHDRELMVQSRLVQSAKTDVLPGSGIDTKKEIPLHHTVKKRSVCFLFVARLIKDKGLLEYIEAARILKSKYPEAEFAVLGPFYHGNPTALSEEEVYAWEREGIIRYLGVSDDVENIIIHADCVVLPSYREGLSRVLLEASLLAKPIITTDVPGCRELVDEGYNGYLCRVKDSRDLAEKMERMYLLEDLDRILMGLHGREKIVNEFDEKIVIEKYLDAIETVLH